MGVSAAKSATMDLAPPQPERKTADLAVLAHAVERGGEAHESSALAGRSAPNRRAQLTRSESGDSHAPGPASARPASTIIDLRGVDFRPREAPGPASLRIQRRMRVSSPSDAAEIEADEIGRRVAHMPAPAFGAGAPSSAPRFPSPSLVQRRAVAPVSASPATMSGIAASRGHGAPLPSPVRSFMEPRFGADLSQVRVHTGAQAASLSNALAANAFTVGRDIYFNSGQFRPETSDGLELIAHELAHTIQQGEVIQRSAAAAPVAERTAPSVQRRASDTGSDPDGGRTYRTLDGRTIELPDGMTAAEARKLEMDGVAAKRRLGQGPAPKPVPDVHNPAEKKAKQAPKQAPRAPSGAHAKHAGGPHSVGVKAQLKLLASKVGQYLVSKAVPVLARGIGKISHLSLHQQTHDDAGQKVHQAEKAVVIPESDGQARSNFSQVGMIAARPSPEPDENKAKRELTDSLAQNVPKTIEDVDNFKRDMKAQHTGADVLKVVQTDKNAVVSAFGDIEQAPPPLPPEHAPEALPAPEGAPPTGAMNLGKDAIAPLQPEHTDVSQYTKQADDRLQQEGVTQEQLDMVDSGDLAEANREKRRLEKAARTEPQAVQNFAKDAAAKLDGDLQQEERAERDALAAHRRQSLHRTGEQQKGAKSALEKKRAEVAEKINGIYKTAQDSVKKKLANLETQSMKRFDEGNADASKAFEDNVNRELDAYKDDRYSGVFGWARKAKDWLLGMDDLPRVKRIFETNRSTFERTIKKLVDDITTDNKRVVQQCKQELAKAKADIKEYAEKLGPELKDVANKTAGEVNSKLDQLDGFIRDKEEALQKKLADKQQAAIKAIDEKIAKMKEAMSGALAKLGNLLLLAAKKFFTWALGQFGYSLSEIERIIDRGVVVLKAIFTKPIVFVKNLIAAAKSGFQNFGKNFLTHLKDAIFDWLTGSLEGVTLPSSWDLKGIASVALQILGLTWAHIRARMTQRMGETVVKTLETSFDLVVALVRDGPMAAWEKLKEMGDEIKQAFIEGVQDFIKMKIVEEAIKWVIALFIPGAGIVKAIIAIYDTIVFFIQKAKQIAEFIGSFLGSVGEIAMGNIAAAANALEHGLATGLKLVISFLASLLHLGGITAKIRNAIQKLRAKVDGMLDRIVDWIVGAARKLGRFVAQAGVPNDPAERLRLAISAATAAARHLSGRISRPLLEPILAGLRVRYGLTALEAFERNGRWWARAAINPELQQDLGVPSMVNTADAGRTTGVLDLYRGIYYRDKTTDYAAMDPQQLRDQLIREEDFADAVYAILGITRAEAPTTTLEQRRAAAQIVVVEAHAAHSVADVRPWWQSTRRATLFFQMLQRFVNKRTEFQQELRQRRVTQLAQLAFTDIPFISTTKNPERAAQYAKGVVVATNIPATSLPNTAGKVVGKVFIYLFSGSDLTALRAADIRFLTEAGTIAGHARYSKSDAEVAFTGSIPPENRIGELLVHDNDSTGGVAGQARRMATSSAAGRGGLLPWS